MKRFHDCLIASSRLAAARKWHLEELMRRLLASYDVTHQANQPAVQSHLTVITVEVMCSVQERAGLVQLVTRLAQEVSVRSVR